MAASLIAAACLQHQCRRYHPCLHCCRSDPDIYTEKERGIHHDLPSVVSQFPSDRPVQLRRRLCGHASDSGSGRPMNPWLSMAEFTDLVTISQMTPGPIAINSATFVGIKIAGIPGAVAATFGCILPSCIIVTIIARLYLKYRNMAALQSVLSTLRPAVVALIASAGISILISAFWPEGSIRFAYTNWILVVLFFFCFLLLQKWKANPILVMVLSGILYAGISLLIE